MLRLLFLWILLFFLAQANAQKGARFSYLVVKLNTEYDRATDQHFIRIIPDLHNANAQRLYSLIPYVNRLNAINKTANFYPQVKDTAQPYYNYFLTQSQVLQFVADEGWELLQVGQDIISTLDSEWDNGTRHYYSRLKVEPILYLRKQLE